MEMDEVRQVTPEEKWQHDVKNQLGIVLGFSDLLLSDMEPADPRRADVEEINRAAQRALDLIARATAVAAPR